jgi:hypothetical protein
MTLEAIRTSCATISYNTKVGLNHKARLQRLGIYSTLLEATILLISNPQDRYTSSWAVFICIKPGAEGSDLLIEFCRSAADGYDLVGSTETKKSAFSDARKTPSTCVCTGS